MSSQEFGRCGRACNLEPTPGQPGIRRLGGDRRLELDLEHAPGVILGRVTFYSPAETAQKTGFTIDTLRYYEKIGVLDGIDRTASGRRRFTADDLGLLGMLSCLRDTGMPVAEMKRYAELIRAGEHTIADRVALLEAHDRRIDEQMATLLAQQARIRGKINYYRGVTASI
jgi:DNA-binding transcriptional MerR regulator